MSAIDYGVRYGEKKVIEQASSSCFDKTNSRTLVRFPSIASLTRAINNIPFLSGPPRLS
jgi:hypothetical protein